jgi:hypothetical protein
MAAINDFVDAGYEVHVNFSPVIISDTWLCDWEVLLRRRSPAGQPKGWPCLPDGLRPQNSELRSAAWPPTRRGPTRRQRTGNQRVKFLPPSLSHAR